MKETDNELRAWHDVHISYWTMIIMKLKKLKCEPHNEKKCNEKKL